jgi:flavin prenyltransferase
VRIVVAVTGASGVVYGLRALQQLRLADNIETHLILTKGALETIRLETDFRVEEFESIADVVHRNRDLGATIASGSYRTDGMLVAPCSIKTLSGIANSYADTLVVRAADVTLKERRRLVLLVRETPLHAGHLRLMTKAAAAGAIIAPPVPAFYTRPTTIDDVIAHTVGRALDLLNVPQPHLRRWEGRPASARQLDEATATDCPSASPTSADEQHRLLDG